MKTITLTFKDSQITQDQYNIGEDDEIMLSIDVKIRFDQKGNGFEPVSFIPLAGILTVIQEKENPKVVYDGIDRGRGCSPSEYEEPTIEKEAISADNITIAEDSIKWALLDGWEFTEAIQEKDGSWVIQ